MNENMKLSTGDKIRKFRLEKKFTQKHLAELCGMYESQIRKYETGKAYPKIQTLQKIADALNVRLLSLLDNDSYEMKIGVFTKYNPFTGEPEPEEDEYIDLTDRAKLIDCYDNKLNDLGKEEALKRLEELAEIKKYSQAPEIDESLTAAHNNGATPEQAAAADAIMKDNAEWKIVQ